MWWKRKKKPDNTTEAISDGTVVPEGLTQRTVESLTNGDSITDPEVVALLMSGTVYYDGTTMRQVDDEHREEE